jgi:hypothetical protein
MHLLAKKLELAKNHFISPSKVKTKMISKFEKYRKIDANLLS